MALLRRLTIVASLASLLGGCTGVSSVDIGSSGDSHLGIAYHLPTTLIPLAIQINKTTDRITVSAQQPLYVPDLAEGELRLKSNYSLFHAETVDLKTTENGLLTNITFDSDGRLDETLVNLAKSAGAILRPESSTGSGTIDVLQTNIDLAELADGTGTASQPSALDKLNNRINAALRKALRKANSGFLAEAKKSSYPAVLLSVRRMIGSGTAEGEDRNKCEVGFCYRRPIPYAITAVFFDDTAQEHIVEVPNGAPIRAAQLGRGVFTKWSNTMVLRNGMLTNYKYVTDASESEKLALLPFELTGGLVDGLTRQGELWDAASTRLDKELAYRDKVTEFKKRPEASIVKGSTLFSLSAGKPFQGGNLNNQQLRQSSAKNGGLNSPGGKKTSGNLGTGG